MSVLNAELDGDLDPDRFDHLAVWNHARVVDRDAPPGPRTLHDARLEAIDLDVHFDGGEELHTEISAKFRVEQVEAELHEGGFVVEGSWTDPDGDFLLTLARPYC